MRFYLLFIHLVFLAIVIFSSSCRLEQHGAAPPDGSFATMGKDAEPDGSMDASADIDAGPDAIEGDAGDPDALDGGAQEADGGPDDAGTTVPCPDDSALLGCWPFENSTEDRSPHAHRTDADDVQFDEGVVGRAAELGASSDLRVRHDNALSPQRLTIEAWVYLERIDKSNRAGIVDKNGQYGLFLYEPGRVRCSGGGKQIYSADRAIQARKWTHLACVHDGEDLRLYVDGVLVRQAEADDLASGNADLHIGENSPNGQDQLIGRIDELRIWREARRADELGYHAR